MLLSLLCSLASAQPPMPDEHEIEITVYDDAFARWDDTRWLVEAELVTPLGTWLAADINQGVTSYAYQVRSVWHCHKDARLGSQRHEVFCAIEDIAIQATTQRHQQTARGREVAQQVLDEVDAALTGASVQLQVHAGGGVPNIDIEGFEAHNKRQRAAREGIRQLVSRLVAGYHLRIPDGGQRPGQSIERNPTLMEVPSLAGVRGSSMLVHTVSPWGEYHLVQSMGEGVVRADVPAPRVSTPLVRLEGLGAQVPMGDAARGGGAPSDKPKTRLTPYEQIVQDRGGAGARFGPSKWLDPEEPHEVERAKDKDRDGGVLDDVELSYELSASGVALFDDRTGVLTERVWTVTGTATAGSLGGSVSTPPFRNVGRLRLLAADEHPDLGPTQQVQWPGAATGGSEPRLLPGWTPLQVTGRPRSVAVSPPGARRHAAATTP